MEQQVSKDLDVRRYPFKWKDAKRITKGNSNTMSYWLKVRKHFLELGGEYLPKVN
jgi:hypothetical protein